MKTSHLMKGGIAIQRMWNSTALPNAGEPNAVGFSMFEG